MSRIVVNVQTQLAGRPVTPREKDDAVRSVESAIGDSAQLRDPRSKVAFAALERKDFATAEQLFLASTRFE
jgi:hypothetical protein